MAVRDLTQSTALKIVGYVRVSTDEQAQEGVSLQAQVNQITCFAESQGWELGTVYQDDHGGSTLDRPGLRQLLRDVKAGSVGTILVCRVDRLTRKQKDLWYLLEDVFEDNSVGFKSISEPFDTTTPQGKAFLGMIGVFSQLERDTIAERTRVALAQKRRQGEHVGRIPFGYAIAENGRLQKDSRQQQAIAKIKRLRRQGKSIREIAGRLGISSATVCRLGNTNQNSRNAKYIK